MATGKLYYLLGKSASGKDTLYRLLKEDSSLNLHCVIPYTTRPRRDREQEGEEYFFIDGGTLEEYQKAGKVIEFRTYDTVHGPWSYATMDDGQLDWEKGNYLMVGVLASYESLRDYYGEDRVVPLYIEVEDGERLARALERERKQQIPRYAELCRRFLADSEDFSEEQLISAGISRRYENRDLGQCLKELQETIKGEDG